MIDLRLLIGAIVAGLGVLVGVALILLPGPTVARSRRRWREETPDSALTTVSQAGSDLANRLLGSRRAGLADRLELAGIRQQPQDFVLLVAAAAVALAAAGMLLGGLIVAVVLALLAVPGAAMLVSAKTERRRKAFALQFDETLQVLSGSLRAGYSLPQAISTAAAEMDTPTNEELARVVNEARVGRPLVEALDNSAQRMKNEDFFWTVQAIAINREVGGNLADVLEGVGETIRERTHLKRQVEALAAEGKFSAIILVLLPIAVGVLISVMNPGYINRLFTEPLGLLMVGVGIVLLIAGSLWMRVLIRIKF